MSDVIDAIRAKYPQYANVPDDKLTVAIGNKYPAYLEGHPQFAVDFAMYSTPNVGPEDSLQIGIKPETYPTKVINGQTFVVPPDVTKPQKKPIAPLIDVPPAPQSKTQQVLNEYAPEKLNNALQNPVYDYLPSGMKQALSAGDFAMEVAAKNPSDKFMGMVAGITSGLGSTAQAFTSPTALSLTPSAGMSKAGQKAVGLIFGAQMIAQNPEIGSKLGEEYAKPPEQRDTAKIGQLLTQLFANSTIAGLAAKHAVGGLIDKTVAPVAPATAEALKQSLVSGSTLKTPEGAKPPDFSDIEATTSKPAGNALPVPPKMEEQLKAAEISVSPGMRQTILDKKIKSPVALQRVFPNLNITLEEAQEVVNQVWNRNDNVNPKYLKGGESDASSISQTTEVHGNVRPLETSTSELPKSQGSGGVQPQGEIQKPQPAQGTGPENVIPLGLNRPSVQNPSLKILTDEEFDKEFSAAKQGVNAAEKGMDDAFDAGKELTPEQRQSIATAQNRWEAADLERFRRNTKDTVPEDLFYKLKNLAQSAVQFGPESSAHQKARIILEELSRQGANPDEMLAGINLTSPDAAEVFKADLEDIKKISQTPSKVNPSDLQPALLIDGKPVTGGANHQEIFNNLPDDIKLDKGLDAFADDSKHVFVDKSGKVYTRQQAADALGQKEPLHSEDLTNLKQSPGTGNPDGGTKNGPVAEVRTPAQSSDSSTAGIAQRVTEARGTAAEPGTGINPEDSVQHGRELLEKGADPIKTIEDFEKSKKFGREDVAIVRAYLEKLQRAANAAADARGEESPEFKAAQKAEEDWVARTKPIMTEWSQSGRFMQGETDIDTGTFHGLQRAHRDATREDFTPAQAVKAKSLAKESKQADTDAVESKKALYENLDKEAGLKPAISDHVIKLAEKIVKKLDERADNSRKELAKIFARTSAGVDLTIVGHLANIAASHIGHVGLDFAKWSDDMVKQFGEKVKPYLDRAWAAAQNKQDLKASIPKAAKPQTDVQKVWNHAKTEYLDKGVNDFGTMVNGTAVDLGMSTADVRKLLAQPKGAKKLTDEMYLKMRNQRRIQTSAKNWLKEQQRPGWSKFVTKTPSALFNIAVFGHGTVGMITHVGNQMFYPLAAKDYWTNFMRQYPLAFGPSGIYHAKMIEDLQHEPLYPMAVRSGLVVDPNKFVDDYQVTPVTKWFAQMGNRGFDALKLYRMARFKAEWNAEPASTRTPERAKMMSDEINHSSGVVKASIPKALQSTLTTAFFAPKLEASRWAWLIGDPASMVKTGITWEKSTPEQRQTAISQLKKKAWVIGTYAGALAVNQGLLSATGSNQKINWSDPSKPDWLSFKAGGHNVGIVGPVVGLARFLGKELLDIAGPRTKFQKLQGSRLDKAASDAGKYARNKVSPFGGMVADAADRHDWAGNTLPWSNEKPKYADSHKLGYLEYASAHIPIPMADAAQEVWKGMGMNQSMTYTLMNAVITGAVIGGTGAKLSEDVQEPKKGHLRP